MRAALPVLLLLVAAVPLALAEAPSWTVSYRPAERDAGCRETAAEAFWGPLGDLAACVVTVRPGSGDDVLHLRVVDAVAPRVGGVACVGPHGCDGGTWFPFCREAWIEAAAGARLEVHLGGNAQVLCGEPALALQPVGGEVRFGPPPPP